MEGFFYLGTHLKCHFYTTVYLLPEHLDQLSNLNIDLALTLLLLIDICSN